MRFLLVLPILLLAACASTSEAQKAQADSSAAVANARALEATARIKEAEARIALAAKVDATGAANALLVDSLKGLGLGAQAQPVQVIQQPQSLAGVAWQAFLQIADLGLRGWSVKANRDVALAQSNNNRDVALSTNATFTGIANSGFTANSSIAGMIQAPAANVTNTTLSGTGVLGSGTFTAPVTTTTTTTRNCQGGAAAAGGNGAGTTTGGSGGLGGSAPGGNC